MRLYSRLVESRDAGDTAAVSFEVFVPSHPDAVELMRTKLDRFAGLEPLFLDVSGYGGRDTFRDSVKLALHAKKYAGLASLVHIQHGLMRKGEITDCLDEAQSAGVRDIFVEHGSGERKPQSDSESECHVATSPLEATAGALAADALSYFGSALELITFIRQRYQDAFFLVVAGYPGSRGEGGESYEAGLRTLAQKQAAGAQLVLVQHVYEAAEFLAFASDAARAGVTIPLIPSIMLLQNAACTARVNEAVGARVPAHVRAALAAAEGDEQAYRQAGVRLTVALCRDLLSAGVTSLHFLTLNLENVAKSILTELGLCGPDAAARRKLPWRPSGDEARRGEDVRPIFWANRPASYVERTSAWTSFPCGRWGTSGGASETGGASKTFQEIPDSQLVPASAGSAEERRAMWGEVLRSEDDVWSVFASYVEGRVPRLPWCETALLPETGTIQSHLSRINRAGFLTINSQPRVNAARSDDPTFGWGGPGGYIYQKAYVECFCPSSHLCALMEVCATGRRSSVTYHAVDEAGRCFTNSKAGVSAAAACIGGCSSSVPSDSAWSSVTAVTWGVFPDKEILQPTVMDPEAFRGAWKAEAFALWVRQWAVIYDQDSDAADLLHTVHDSYWLVSLVDNDFIGGDVFGVFEDAVRKLQGQVAGQVHDPAAMYASLAARGALSGTPPLAGRTGSYTTMASLAATSALTATC